jgi:hypothetical protein
VIVAKKIVDGFKSGRRSGAYYSIFDASARLLLLLNSEERLARLLQLGYL